MRSRGFTIVELLIVIVVIAILAAITIVAYNGIQNQARASVVQSDVSQAVRALEAAKIRSGTNEYPADQAAAGLKASSNVTLNYYYEQTSRQYCVEGIIGTTAYSSLGNSRPVQPGRCSENGLMAWWRLNNTGDDASGNGYTATLSNVSSTTGQSGVANGALSFNGTDSRVSISHNTAFALETLSISTWIRPAAWNSPTATAFFTKRTGSNGIFLFYLNSPNTIHFDHGGSSARWNTGYTPPLNQWTHLVITSSPAGRTLYVNGAQAATTSQGIDAAGIANTGPLALGQDSSGTAYFLTGAMDDTRYYNRILTAGEAASLYSRGAQ